MPRHTRQRTVTLLIFPLLLILWAIAWALFYTGDKQQETTRRQKQKDNLHITVKLPTQEQEITN